MAKQQCEGENTPGGEDIPTTRFAHAEDSDSTAIHSWQQETTASEVRWMNGVPTIDHWVGQRDVIARFRVALEAAWNDGCRLPHMLLVGGPGLGKTELAHVAAREVGVQIHERLGQTLVSAGTLNALLLGAEEKEIVFIDEIHELHPKLQTTLYRAMEDRQVFVRGRNETTHNMPLNDITILGATTDEFALLPPLRDRFKLVLPFTFYDLESLAKITLQRAALMGIIISPAIPSS